MSSETDPEIEIKDKHGLSYVVLEPDLDQVLGLEHLFLYERQGDLYRFRFKGMTNHEIRAIIVGLWLKLDADDEIDLIKELTAYLDPNETPSRTSLLIRDVLKME